MHPTEQPELQAMHEYVRRRSFRIQPGLWEGVYVKIVSGEPLPARLDLTVGWPLEVGGEWQLVIREWEHRHGWRRPSNSASMIHVCVRGKATALGHEKQKYPPSTSWQPPQAPERPAAVERNGKAIISPGTPLSHCGGRVTQKTKTNECVLGVI